MSDKPLYVIPSMEGQPSDDEIMDFKKESAKVAEAIESDARKSKREFTPTIDMAASRYAAGRLALDGADAARIPASARDDEFYRLLDEVRSADRKELSTISMTSDSELRQVYQNANPDGNPGAEHTAALRAVEAYVMSRLDPMSEDVAVDVVKMVGEGEGVRAPWSLSEFLTVRHRQGVMVSPADVLRRLAEHDAAATAKPKRK